MPTSFKRKCCHTVLHKHRTIREANGSISIFSSDGWIFRDTSHCMECGQCWTWIGKICVSYDICKYTMFQSPSLYLINKHYMFKSWDERQLFGFVFDHHVTLQLFVFSRFPFNGEIYSLACQGCKNTFFSFVRGKMNSMSRGKVHWPLFSCWTKWQCIKM